MSSLAHVGHFSGKCRCVVLFSPLYKTLLEPIYIKSINGCHYLAAIDANMITSTTTYDRRLDLINGQLLLTGTNMEDGAGVIKADVCIIGKEARFMKSFICFS